MYVRTLKNVHRMDKDLVGERCVDLAVLHEKEFSVPLSFVITNEAFEEFITANNLMPRISNILSGNNLYERMRELFLAHEIPDSVVSDIVENYESLSITQQDTLNNMVQAEETPYVMLTLSPNYTVQAENNEGIILNVHGLEQLLLALREAWACLFTPNMVHHRDQAGIGNTNLNAGVIVQQQLKTEVTTEGWSATTGHRDEITVKSYYGLPDLGQDIEKDEFRMTQEYLKPVYQSVTTQTMQLQQEEGQLSKNPLGVRGEQQKLNDKIMIELARLSKKAARQLEHHVKVFFSVKGETIHTLIATRLLLTQGSVKLQKFTTEETIEEPEIQEEPDSEDTSEHVVDHTDIPADEEDVTHSTDVAESSDVEYIEMTVEETDEPMEETEEKVESIFDEIADEQEAEQSPKEPEEHADEQPEDAEYVELPVENSAKENADNEESIFSAVIGLENEYTRVTEALRKRYEARFNNEPPEKGKDIFFELSSEIIIPHEELIGKLIRHKEDNLELSEDEEDAIREIIESFIEKIR